MLSRQQQFKRARARCGQWIAAIALTLASATFVLAATPVLKLTLQSISVAGVKRWFIVVKPESLPPGAPVVLLLHGGTQSMHKALDSHALSAWSQAAKAQGFILVVPNGTSAKGGNTAGNRQNWNDGRSDSAAGDQVADDVTFLTLLVDWALREYGADARRVFITGASNGGMMTYRMLIERPTALLIVNGTADPVMPWSGGRIAPGNRGTVLSADATKRWWLQTNHVNQTPALSDLPDLVPNDDCRMQREDFPALPGGAPVAFITMQGGGHYAPSQLAPQRTGRLVKRIVGKPCRDAEAVDLAWQFFQQSAEYAR